MRLGSRENEGTGGHAPPFTEGIKMAGRVLHGSRTFRKLRDRFGAQWYQSPEWERMLASIGSGRRFDVVLEEFIGYGVVNLKAIIRELGGNEAVVYDIDYGGIVPTEGEMEALRHAFMVYDRAYQKRPRGRKRDKPVEFAGGPLPEQVPLGTGAREPEADVACTARIAAALERIADAVEAFNRPS